MVIEVHSLNRADAEWNARLERSPAGTIAQSTHIESYYTVTSGWFRPIYLLAVDEAGDVVGQLLVLQGFAGGVQPKVRLLRGVLGIVGRAYSWTGGPLVFALQRRAEICSALIGHIDERAERDAAMIKSASLPLLDEQVAGDEKLFSQCGFGERGAATFLVELQRSEEELWNGLKSSARKNLKKIFAKNEMSVRPLGNREDARRYWQMLVETQQRNAWPVTYGNFELFDKRLWNKPHADGLLHGFLVETQDGEAVSGLLFRLYNGWIQELGVAQSDYGLEKRLYGQDLIKWEIMRWGTSRGVRYYDLMGVEPEADDPKKKGIYQFKAKWGGKLIRQKIFSKKYPGWKSALVAKAAGLRRAV